MKKYRITDEDGKTVEIEEEDVNETPASEPAPAAKPEKPEEPVHDEAFTPEQIEQIKAIVAEALKSAQPAPVTEPTADGCKDDDDEDDIENEVAEKVHDSLKVRKGPASIEASKTQVNDSAAISEEDVDKAWTNRWSQE